MKKESNRYGNCRVFSPEGTLMFLCNRSRVDWYLKRDLCIITQTSPHIEATLTFQPNGLGYANQDDFYFSPRENKCVSCGNDDYSILTRHHIVPTCYRKWMPREYKSHNCYDVVKLCRECHDEYETEAQELKFKIADDLGVEIFKRMANISTIKGYANTLLSHLIKLPDDIFNKMYNSVSEYINKKYLGYDDLESILSMKYSEHPNYKSWGLECIEKVECIDEFIIMWRKHFIEYMQPKYMPDGWEVDKNMKKNIRFNKMIINK
jgi:exonuclease 3'-5' domain-containing protein 2